eukprot:CAMPEP_0202894126 /NCGR_PEP_ID=MMETSP1392-20130828/3579_1 /ASSEMBLY_ACC=CAM_ASM_000868 /TAXON_ID=225041 /ORGANISM="Chlamydomonas chlamydogama, Strain SAG 11-48b" /LENGTH=255 /DNA_ID=CAMNT_0049578707 /DNA_START=317 /DNA_END=1084 /DNA_ORIENTATION=-
MPGTVDGAPVQLPVGNEPAIGIPVMDPTVARQSGAPSYIYANGYGTGTSTGPSARPEPDSGGPLSPARPQQRQPKPPSPQGSADSGPLDSDDNRPTVTATFIPVAPVEQHPVQPLVAPAQPRVPEPRQRWAQQQWEPGQEVPLSTVLPPGVMAGPPGTTMVIATAPPGSGMPTLVAQQLPNGTVVVQEIPVHVPFECTCGWILFGFGFICPLCWLIGTFLPFCSENTNDRRAAVGSSIAFIIFVFVIVGLAATAK